MESLFKDKAGHLFYAMLTEQGQNSCQRLVSDDAQERAFLIYLDDEPTAYSLFELNRFYIKFINQQKQES
jgi:hypothetical protein